MQPQGASPGLSAMLTGGNTRVEGKPGKAHIIDPVGRDDFFKTFLEAMEGCRQPDHAGAAPAKN